jgi:hypothetical protein
MCKTILSDIRFVIDYQIPLACYCTDNSSNNIIIPYNIYTCGNCKTSQTKYLGNLDEIYKINHADSTGEIMRSLHIKMSNIINNYIDNGDIKGIVEIGSAKGVLADLIIENNNLKKYHIVEPSYFGNRENKIIIDDYFENTKISDYSEANCVILSHIFEHFYNPIEILEKISSNDNLNYCLLAWPDLEYYKNNNIYHVLNTEHTFYIDNNFIVDLFNNHKFQLLETTYHENHTVIFIFRKNNNLPLKQLINCDNNINYYYDNLLIRKQEIINFIENAKMQNKCIAIWPCSVHTQFLLMILKIDTIDIILDNSPQKIGKYLYGHNLKCESFSTMCNDPNIAIILNGGCFNKEIIKNVNMDNVIVI